VVLPRFSLPIFALACTLVCGTAHAQRNPNEHLYVVRRGDSLRRVAEALQVSPISLAARNGLHTPYALRIGRRLRVPTETSPEILRALPTRGRLDATSADDDDAAGGAPAERAAPREGTTTLVRTRDLVEVTMNLRGGPREATRIERFLRFRDGSRHVIHPRLVRTLALFAEHFNGHRIVVLSGFRPMLRNARGPRRRHSLGYAVDIRVERTALAAVQSFCESLENLGCGIYPHANFVHVDVRLESAAWTDESSPNTHGARRPVDGSDESVFEVLEDAARIRQQ
jgi:uncharacterized protein YcbK (DUF882 family)